MATQGAGWELAGASRVMTAQEARGGNNKVFPRPKLPLTKSVL